MTPVSPARSRSRFFAIVMALATVAAAAAACTQSLRANGADCLKDQDCLSGVCAQSQCRAAPPLLDAEVSADGFGVEAGDATMTDGGTESGPEAAPMGEAGSEAATDGGNRSDGSLQDGASDAGEREGGEAGEAGSPEAATPESGATDSSVD